MYEYKSTYTGQNLSRAGKEICMISKNLTDDIGPQSKGLGPKSVI